MPKREKKQKRDGNLATALKAANVTTESYKEPEIKINAKALATNVACQLLERFHPTAVLAHIDDQDVLARLGFTVLSSSFHIKLDALNRETLDIALDQSILNLIEQISGADGYVAFATPPGFQDDKSAIVTHGGVVAAVCFHWDRPVQAVRVVIAVYALAHN